MSEGLGPMKNHKKNCGDDWKALPGAKYGRQITGDDVPEPRSLS